MNFYCTQYVLQNHCTKPNVMYEQILSPLMVAGLLYCKQIDSRHRILQFLLCSFSYLPVGPKLFSPRSVLSNSLASSDFTSSFFTKKNSRYLQLQF